MTLQLLNDYSQFIATSRDLLCEHGIEVTVGTDFATYATIVTSERPQQALGVPFDPELTKLKARSSFWLIGRNRDGRLIHTQACKIVPLNALSLGQYLLRRFRDFPPAIADIDLPRSRFRAPPGAKNISGTVVYHGEVWMAPDHGTYRGTGLSTVLARTGLLEAFNRWRPDWLFGFMAQQVAFKGFAERMGYMHNEPGALRWYRIGQDKPLEGFLSYLSREELEFLLEIPIADLVTRPVEMTQKAA